MQELWSQKFQSVITEKKSLLETLKNVQSENQELQTKLDEALLSMDRFKSEKDSEMKGKIESLQEQHLNAVNKLKQQYLETLKSMRDDVAMSKQRSVEKVKREWEKKKESIEAYWKGKLEELRKQFERY